VCGDEYESVSHIMWECLTYVSSRSKTLKTYESLGESHREGLDHQGKLSFYSEVSRGIRIWNFYLLLSLVKDYVLAIWESRKLQLYGDKNVHYSIPVPVSGFSWGYRAMW
jgi:hypothetical protein